MAAIPFSDPPWLMGLPSPYYNASHREFQKWCRAFIEKHSRADTGEGAEHGKLLAQVFAKFAEANLLVAVLAGPLPLEWLRKLNMTHIGPVPVEKWDRFHTLIFLDELSRTGEQGPGGPMIVGPGYAIPPILKFGSQELQERFIPDLLQGRVRSCIAITEPDAGSDVANITTTAKKSADGREYIINGAKKWISDGYLADYAVMAVRTGDAGPLGLSLVVVPLTSKGISRRRIATMGDHETTSFIELDDVHVPVRNLVGQEGLGMLYIMTNFNHERLIIAISVTRGSRMVLAAATEYVMRRAAFGQPLINQPVVRHRLANAARLMESQWAWVESFVYQVNHLPKKVADKELGGLTALCKANAGIVLHECAATATLLFGGNGYTKGGQGAAAERAWREVNGARVPGGSEDVMLDLAIRQLVKNYRDKTRELGEGGKGGSKL